MGDKEFLQLAIEQSALSAEKGNFPAGAVVVEKDKIISTGISDKYPGYQHAECMAIDEAFAKQELSGATLYASMEPCLMCLSRAYWAGIRKIVFAISKNKVNPEFYESRVINEEVVKTFNEKIEYIHIQDLEEEALKIVKK